MALWTMTDEEAGKPKYLSDELRNEQTVSDKDATIGISAEEALDVDSATKGLRTPGWVTYTTYTDSSGNTRHKSEVLVAAGSMGSDGDDTLTDDLGGGGGAVIYTVQVDYANSTEFIGGELRIYNPSQALLTFIQTLSGTEAITYTSYGNTYTTVLTSTFVFNSGGSYWAAAAANTGGSYADTLSFS